jgi:hypothetical protein
MSIYVIASSGKKKKSLCFFFCSGLGRAFQDERNFWSTIRPRNTAQGGPIEECILLFFSLYHIACIFHTLNYTNNLPHTVCTQDQRTHIYTHIYYIQILLFRVSDLGARQLANISYFLSFCFLLFFIDARPYTPGVSHLCLTPWRESQAH